MPVKRIKSLCLGVYKDAVKRRNSTARSHTKVKALLMKAVSNYVSDVASHMENAARQMQPTPRLLMQRALPTTTQEITHYIEQLLTKDQQAVCDVAMD